MPHKRGKSDHEGTLKIRQAQEADQRQRAAVVPDPEPEAAQSAAEPADELDFYNEATNQTYIIHDDIAEIL